MQYYLRNYCHQLGFLCEKLYNPPSADSLSLSKNYAVCMKTLFNMLLLNLPITTVNHFWEYTAFVSLVIKSITFVVHHLHNDI